MKLRLPKRRVWRVAIYLISLALVAIALDLVWVEMRRTIHPGYDTTRIVKPTLPDGSIDYLAKMEDLSRLPGPSRAMGSPIVWACRTWKRRAITTSRTKNIGTIIRPRKMRISPRSTHDMPGP